MAARKLKPGDRLDAPPTRVRGYYSTPYGRFRSVTTVLDGGLAAPQLQWRLGVDVEFDHRSAAASIGLGPFTVAARWSA